ncbi:MAG: hypothetical protein U0526_02795 [Candidatus Saccharibacteria bacterium]|jgi:hypothetical protein
MATKSATDVSGWVGWVYFAGIFMIIEAIFQLIAGTVALVNDQLYVLGVERLWIVDVTTWGWIHLFIGIILLFAGGAVMAGKMWGRVVGVLIAALALIANFAFIPVYPIWSVIMVVVSALVIYALVVHGKEAAAELE